MKTYYIASVRISGLKALYLKVGIKGIVDAFGVGATTHTEVPTQDVMDTASDMALHFSSKAEAQSTVRFLVSLYPGGEEIQVRVTEHHPDEAEGTLVYLEVFSAKDRKALQKSIEEQLEAFTKQKGVPQ